jgi:hypothetical protein
VTIDVFQFFPPSILISILAIPLSPAKAIPAIRFDLLMA